MTNGGLLSPMTEFAPLLEFANSTFYGTVSAVLRANRFFLPLIFEEKKFNMGDKRSSLGFSRIIEILSDVNVHFACVNFLNGLSFQGRGSRSTT